MQIRYGRVGVYALGYSHNPPVSFLHSKDKCFYNTVQIKYIKFSIYFYISFSLYGLIIFLIFVLIFNI